MTLKESLEAAQKEVEQLKAEAQPKDEKISALTKQIEQLTADLKKMDDESKSKSKKAAKKDGQDDGDEEDKKDGGKDEEEEDGKGKSKKAKASVELGVEIHDVTELKTKLENAERDLRNSNARVKQLEGEATTVDQAAEVKAREIAARNGGNVPAKDHQAGNQEHEKAANPNAPWRDRLSSFWKIQE